MVDGPSSAYCQPCVSPIWDTALAALAMQEAGDTASSDASVRALDWLLTRQLLDEPADWQVNRPGLAGGGWAFQFANGHYPDLDDTAVVVWAMHQSRDSARYAESMRRALDWLVGMQSKNGGFAAFDADNTCYYLNKIPFADHGALLDPPTSDVTARVVTVLARVGRPQDKPALDRAIAYLREQQEADGSWFGRWGTNYIYGTWSVLTALAQAHVGADDPAVRRAVEWLKLEQNPTAAGARATIPTRKVPGGPGHFPALRIRRPGRFWACSPRARLDRTPCGAVRVPDAHAAGRWPVERSEFHGAGFSARLLFAIPRLFCLLSVSGRWRLTAH